MKADRQIWMGTKALETQWARVKGDSRATCAIARVLAGRGLPAAGAIRGPDGELACTRGERDLLMRGHFATVFKVEIVAPEALFVDVPFPRIRFLQACQSA